MRLSTIIPLYNAERFIAECLESLLHQQGVEGLEQEFIVVDDGSSDASVEIVRRYPQVRLIQQANLGASIARNVGVTYATGDWLSFADADDWCAPNKLSLLLAALSDQAQAELLMGRVQQMPTQQILDGYHVGAILVRAETFRRVGDFDPQYQVGGTVDWFLRAQDKGVLSLQIPDVVYYRRIHGENLVIRQRNDYADYARIVKAALDRRRKL